MTTLTIPKTITRGEELVLITRRKFEELLNVCRKQTYTALDQNLDKAIAQVRRGEIVGPFSNAEDLMQSLQS